MTNESRNGHVIQFPSNLSHNNPYHRNEPSFIGLSLGVALFFFFSNLKQECDKQNNVCVECLQHTATDEKMDFV